MITYNKIGEYVTAEPFRPFRLRMASGRTFEIRHSEMILVGKSSARVYSSAADDATDKALWQDVSLLLMEGIEPVNGTIPESGPTRRLEGS